MNRTRNLKTLGCLALVALALAVRGMNASEAGQVAPVFHPSYQTAATAAAADQSLVLLVFSAEWCGPCKLLKSKTLSAPEFLAQNLPLHVADVDIDADQKMAGSFHVEAVPTLVLLTPDGKIVSRQTGFLKAADLLAWLNDGRAKAAAGQWEGTAPGAQFDEFIRSAAAGDLGTNEIRRLVDWLGDPDPANREPAAKILAAQRENAVPMLIEAVGHPYLGERIAACEVLQRLAPDLAPVDPWQSPAEMSNAVVTLRQWWAATQKLPPAGPMPAPVAANSVKAALEQLRGDDPVRRTAAMTTLVNAGSGALPAVRDAVKRAERGGDPRTLGLLEDVRWTILVPAAIEQQSGGVRQVLARGKSTERQAVAERLGGLGRDALPILAELAGDADPIVVEGAIHALSALKGGDAVAALAGLLISSDSNVRMTAAQALGHTRNAAALKPLVAATTDADEVVACTALSALEESLVGESSRRSKELPAEISAGLQHGLADPRWRVRATAAGVAGKLEDKNLAADLKKLLDDPDGFVVKSALTALGQLGATPEASQLIALGKRLPSLQGDTVELLLGSESDETVKAVTGLFNAGNNDTRVAILGAFLRRGFSGYESSDEGWQPMLSQAVASPDARVRHVAAEVLSRRTPQLAAQLIGSLLADEDAGIRQLAAGKLLEILAQGKTSSSRYRSFSSTGGSESKTNPPVATPAQLAAWHQAIQRHLSSPPDLNQAAALFVTGDGRSDLSGVLAALGNTNQASLPASDDANAIQAMLPKLSLPAGRPVLDKLLDSPVRYAQAAAQARRCPPEIADYLLDPARFKAVMEPAADPALSAALEIVAGSEYAYQDNHGWSLWSETDRAKAIALALVNSTNAAWRAAAVFALGLRADAQDHLPLYARAAADPDPWVRGAALRAIGRNVKNRPALEQSLAPALADANASVAAIAAVALLEPETRDAASLESELDYFVYESIRGGRGETTSHGNDRPLAPLENQPAFLAAARHWLAATNGEAALPFMLLLAQYGDFSGVDRLARPLADAGRNAGRELYPVLTAIALSHDNQYVPLLKQLAAQSQEQWTLRKILQAMKGMSGPDARQLRLDINRKIRNTGSSGDAMPD